MDDETGEFNSAFFKRTDPETGENELMTYFLNKETGEEEYYSIHFIWESLQAQNPFQISRYSLGIPTIVKQDTAKTHSDEIFRDFIAALVFLLPTVIFTPILGLIVVTSAVILHAWCHRQNAKLLRQGDNSIYYQSPFHTIFKEFCSKCIAEEECKKICKIQNKRYNKRMAMKESLKRVVA
ncbi:uncharacterized protein LOC115880929 [Sitophilus oryzae]|uniref:Uncharacterized protein LOC115880929 n=1 Tax=Sitophilus oryzae TaxID=7048 RepID=A0A6J2XSX4_SITOR|nr:uncharacterized protein LOC115880929 [Sitophilus oryzae]